MAFIPALGAAYTLLLLLFQVVRTVLWGLYKPYGLPPGELPKITVIIPAYNEGAMVEKAIYAVTGSNYPSDKIEIICIDDGSKDDTWTYISRAQRRYPTLLTLSNSRKTSVKKPACMPGLPRVAAISS